MISIFEGRSQSIAVGQTATESAVRILQLQGKLDSNFSSLTIRPILSHDSFSLERLLYLTDFRYPNSKRQNYIGLLPISWNTKFNSHHPFGWNDAGMRMVRGFQQSFSAGLFVKAGPLSIQLQPEYYQINPQHYETTAGYGSNDAKKLSKAYWGQSSIRLNTKKLSLGLSTENLWWGPGQFSSIFMSNNAPGFKHFTFNTRKPIQTWIGNFEWQLIVGRLNEDTSLASEINYLRRMPSKNESRYYNGLVITYQPKWMKNLYLGLIRFEQLYNSAQSTRPGGFLKKYLPVLTYESANENIRSTNTNDGGVGIFARWLLPTQQAEVYFEYGYNDFKQNIRDLTVNSNHANAYLAGFKKLFRSEKSSASFIELSGEIINMAQNPGYIIRNGGNWYEHGVIRQGYSFDNQIMGAGSGFGNNVQTLLLKKHAGINHWGFKIQRIQQDPKRVVNQFQNLGMRQFIWNDTDLGFLFQQKIKHFILNAEAHWVISRNYGWTALKRNNLMIQMNLLYILQ